MQNPIAAPIASEMEKTAHGGIRLTYASSRRHAELRGWKSPILSTKQAVDMRAGDQCLGATILSNRAASCLIVRWLKHEFAQSVEANFSQTTVCARISRAFAPSQISFALCVVTLPRPGYSQHT
jgi:hypothetical protein